MLKEWKVERSGVVIRLVNSWVHGAKLYINGDLKDFDKTLLASPKYPMLSGSFANDRGHREVIEVFGKSGLFSVHFVVCSNGEVIFDTRN